MKRNCFDNSQISEQEKSIDQEISLSENVIYHQKLLINDALMYDYRRRLSNNDQLEIIYSQEQSIDIIQQDEESKSKKKKQLKKKSKKIQKIQEQQSENSEINNFKNQYNQINNIQYEDYHVNLQNQPHQRKKEYSEIEQFEQQLEADSYELNQVEKIKINLSSEWIKKLQGLTQKKLNALKNR